MELWVLSHTSLTLSSEYQIPFPEGHLDLTLHGPIVSS